MSPLSKFKKQFKEDQIDFNPGTFVNEKVMNVSNIEKISQK